MTRAPNAWSSPNKMVSAHGWVLAVCATLSGCGGCGDGPPPVVPFDVGPRDSGSEPDAPPDSGIDAGDAAVDEPACTIDLPTDTLVVGRDSDVSRWPVIVTAATDDALMAVFSSDDIGERRIRRIAVRLPEGVFEEREDLAGIPPGAGAPSLLRVADGWWVAYEDAGRVRLQRYDEAFAVAGDGVTVAEAGVRPKLGRLGADAVVVAWATALPGEVRVRAFGLDGVPRGEPEAVEALAEGARFDISPLGTEGAAAMVVVGRGPDEPGGLRGAVVSSTGALGELPETFDLGTSGALGSGAVSLGASPPEAPAGVSRLEGGVAFDVTNPDTGFSLVRFAVVDDTGAPPFGQFTISPRRERASGVSLAPLGTGYVASFRANPEDDSFTRIRVALMGRESCEFGGVDDTVLAGVTASFEGGDTSIAAAGREAFLVGWSEQLADQVEYRVSLGRCE